MFKNVYNKIFKTTGFTLIELVIIMAVLSILAAVAVPRLSGFKATAENKVDEVNASVLTGIAHKMLAEEGRFPDDWGENFDKFPSGKTDYLDNNILIQNPDNEFKYDVSTGTVTVGKVRGASVPETLDSIIKGLDDPTLINLFTFSTIDDETEIAKNPVLFVPSIPGRDDIIFTFIPKDELGNGNANGNPKIIIDINGKVANITRGNGNSTKTLMITLEISRSAEEPIIRYYNVNIPGGESPYEEVTITEVS